MGKYLITGSPGTGRSTVIRTLANHGFTAYDTDSMPGVSQLQFRATGKPADTWPAEPIDWSMYAWNWQTAAIERLLASADTVFLGGIVSNQDDFYDHFAAIYVLSLDAAVLRQRILNRIEKDYGKQPDELAGLLNYHATRESQLLAAPQAVAIDAAQPLEKVVDEIIAHVRNHR